MLNKSEVNFQSPATPGMNHCGDCVHFQSGNRCNIVSGVVLAGDWCDRFKGETVKRSKQEINSNQDECCTQLQGMQTSEHDTIKSRITGRTHEIMFGPQDKGNVPKNPFASLAQAGYLHSHPEKLGPEKLAEFDAATKGKKLPKHVK